MAAVADTSFILAMLNEADRSHHACLEAYDQENVIYLPQSVLSETAYMLTSIAGNPAAARFLRGLTSARFTLAALEAQDMLRIADMLDQYADSRLDFVDASVAAVADRLAITRIFTLDRRDFSMLRPRQGDYFELVP